MYDIVNENVSFITAVLIAIIITCSFREDSLGTSEPKTLSEHLEILNI